MQTYWDIFSINVLYCQINYQFPQGAKMNYGTDSPLSSTLFYIYIYSQIPWISGVIYFSHLLVVSAENHHQVIFTVHDESTQYTNEVCYNTMQICLPE